MGLLLAPALVYVLFQYNGNVLLSSQMPLTRDAPVAHFIVNEWQLMNHFLPMANTRRLVLMDAAWVLGDGEFVELIADNVDAAIAAEPENWLFRTRLRGCTWRSPLTIQNTRIGLNIIF